MSAPILERQHFSIARAAEYFKLSELQAQTGQPANQFLHVVLKELLDNALDAAEKAIVAPDITVEYQHMGESRLRLAIVDNGPGIPPSIVEKLLDFATRTSDKAAYRAPTRGAQGNALKTVLGIPIALGDETGSLRIEAAGVIHDITIWITPAGEVKHTHRQTPAETYGTRIETTIPPYSYGMAWQPNRWLFTYALFNPHASLQIREIPPPFEQAEHEESDFLDLSFSPTIHFPEDKWRKFLPSDTTPSGWYTGAEFATLVHLKAAVHPDQPIGDFIREFRGLSRKWREVGKSVIVKTVEQLAKASRAIPILHQAMQTAAPLPNPEVLGRVGPDHFRKWFDDYTIKPDRYWYKHRFGEAEGMPYLVEVAIAETETGDPDFFYGLNFSVPFANPLADTLLMAEGIRAYGPGSFLRERGVYNGCREGRPLQTMVALHLVMPLLPALDRGKSRLAIPRALADAVAEVLTAASKTLADEWRRWQKNKAQQFRAIDEEQRQQRAELMTKKAAAESLMLPVYLETTDQEALYITSRDFWYVLRPPYQKLAVRPSKKRSGDRKESAELDYGYFSQQIMPPYRREVHPLIMIDYKARGTLYDPHSGNEILIGDKELRDYEFPLWQFNKILFIEKDGVWETLKQTGGIELAKRYDMAIASCAGYATEATRKLFAKAQQGEGYQIFVWHDADPYGYNIARTLAQETARMPNHRIQVFDLGLKIEDAIDAGYQTETFDRDSALMKTLIPTLSARERQLFEGKKTHVGPDKTIWTDCQRVEINAIPIKERVAYLERQLAKIAGLLPKVKPPESELVKAAEAELKALIETRVRTAVEARLNIDAIVDEALKRVGIPFTFNGGGLSGRVDEQHQRRPEQSWREILNRQVERQLDSAQINLRITGAIDDVIANAKS